MVLAGPAQPHYSQLWSSVRGAASRRAAAILIPGVECSVCTLPSSRGSGAAIARQGRWSEAPARCRFSAWHLYEQVKLD